MKGDSREHVKCPCGGAYRRCDLTAHCSTNRHQKWETRKTPAKVRPSFICPACGMELLTKNRVRHEASSHVKCEACGDTIAKWRLQEHTDGHSIVKNIFDSIFRAVSVLQEEKLFEEAKAKAIKESSIKSKIERELGEINEEIEDLKAEQREAKLERELQEISEEIEDLNAEQREAIIKEAGIKDALKRIKRDKLKSLKTQDKFKKELQEEAKQRKQLRELKRKHAYEEARHIAYTKKKKIERKEELKEEKKNRMQKLKESNKELKASVKNFEFIYMREQFQAYIPSYEGIRSGIYSVAFPGINTIQKDERLPKFMLNY